MLRNALRVRYASPMDVMTSILSSSAVALVTMSPSGVKDNCAVARSEW